jgi:hypothetical protein
LFSFVWMNRLMWWSTVFIDSISTEILGTNSHEFCLTINELNFDGRAFTIISDFERMISKRLILISKNETFVCCGILTVNCDDYTCNWLRVRRERICLILPETNRSFWFLSFWFSNQRIFYWSQLFVWVGAGWIPANSWWSLQSLISWFFEFLKYLWYLIDSLAVDLLWSGTLDVVHLWVLHLTGFQRIITGDEWWFGFCYSRDSIWATSPDRLSQRIK